MRPSEFLDVNTEGVLHGVLVEYVQCDKFDIIEKDSQRCITTVGYPDYQYNFISGFSLIDGMIRLAQTSMTENDILSFFRKYKILPVNDLGKYLYPIDTFKLHVNNIQNMVKALNQKKVSDAYKYCGPFDFKIELRLDNNDRWFLAPTTTDLFEALEYQLLATNLNDSNGLLRTCTNCGTSYITQLSHGGVSRPRRPRKRADGTIEPTFCSDNCRVTYNRKKKGSVPDGKHT